MLPSRDRNTEDADKGTEDMNPPTRRLCLWSALPLLFAPLCCFSARTSLHGPRHPLPACFSSFSVSSCLPPSWFYWRVNVGTCCSRCSFDFTRVTCCHGSGLAPLDSLLISRHSLCFYLQPVNETEQSAAVICSAFKGSTFCAKHDCKNFILLQFHTSSLVKDQAGVILLRVRDQPPARLWLSA